jgi:CubicO group peptidase (beta-lactamase class C family)
MKTTLVMLLLVVAMMIGCGPEGRIVEAEVTTAPEVRVVEVTATPTPIPTLTSTPQVSIEPVSPTGQPTHTPVSVSYWPTGGWRTSTPEEQGIDSEMLAEMLGMIQEEDYDIDSVTIIRNGYMVADATVYPFGPDSRHIIRSCTKSIVSALIGIAIDKGYIEGVDQSVLDIFPERSAANLDALKEAMTLEHVLMMASGLECRDSYLYRWRGLDEMWQSDDWVQFMLDLPMAEPPGTRFEYCNGGSFLLSAIIQETTGMSASEFAEEYLFGPLGISDVEWPSNPRGISIGWGKLHMRPHDMAKIGYLYLNEGRWDGEQIVPAAWVAASTRKHISATLQDGYGYQWWVTDDGVYMALGYAGQFIFVVPEKALVVAFTSELEERDFYVPQNLLDCFIIPAAESSTPLPANPDGVELLGARIEALANP